MTEINLPLSGDQALVLFDLLASLSDGSRSGPELNPAEQSVLDHLESTLERILVEPFEGNYVELVEQARARVEASGG